MHTEKLVNVKEMAEIMGVNPNTIYTWIKEGAPIPHIKVGRTIKFRPAHVLDALEVHGLNFSDHKHK